MKQYQLVIIGGGASGLASAVQAQSMGLHEIAILEKLPRIGKKILATGNGHCNLSHENITSDDYYGSIPTKTLQNILSDFGTAEDFFQMMGLYTRTDSAGRIYPYNMTANAVLDAFRLTLEQTQTEIFCNQNVTRFYKKGDLWHIVTDEMEFLSKNVIFSAGGHASPKLGTDGTAWKLLESLNISISTPKPILCPLISDKKQLHSLKGIRIKGNIALYDRSKLLRTESGEIQFNENNLSGICVFNLSHLVDTRRIQDFSLSIDCIPEDTAENTLDKLYVMRSIRYNADSENMLSGLLVKPMARHILKVCGIRADYPCNALTDRQLQQIAHIMHHVVFPVMNTGTFEQAQATAGGVKGSALDEYLQVKKYSGLYVIGEAVDIHADCGGYHLHWCWASATRAVKNIVI
ncbi:MAG: aminoacetone oxidase family FAD-binding enzyme [Oscillospiraceae bacterium]